MNILIFSKDALWHGGVVNFIETLKKNFSDDISPEQFLIGSRRGRSGTILKLFMPLFDSLRLIAVMITKRYDVYHLNPSLNPQSAIRDGLFLFLVRLFTSKKIVVFFHGWEISTQNALDRSRLLKYLFRKVFDKADAILVLAKPFKTWLVDAGFDESKILLYTTMFDGDMIKRGRNQKTNNDINMLFLSRFVKEKGIYELLEAFLRLTKKYDNIKLNFAGAGDEETAMQSWVTEKRLSEKVKFWGYVRDEDKETVFSQSDIFVFPTYYGEGCPVSLLEAMAAGLGVVTTPVGGIPDVILSTDNGILIDEKVTVDEVYDALDRLLTYPDLLNKMKGYNVDDAWRRFEASVVTKQIEKIYHA